MKQYINHIHYSRNLGFPDRLLKDILGVFSIGYSFGVNIRKLLYENEILQKVKLPAYVISVGNLTTGGTGKTPITVEIAKYIREKYYQKVAILSHGYGGKLSTKDINIVSDGKNIFHTPYYAGDEPYWIALNTKDIPVITGKDRVETGSYAIENLGTEVLVLDDGFQHIRLERDLNILVIDCHKKFGNVKLLPAGPLREPVNQIKRADKVIVVNKKAFDKDSAMRCGNFAEFLKERFNKPVYLCNFTNDGIYNIKTSESLDLSQKVYAFAGIAQPEFFFSYLKEQNIDLVCTREYSDHHLYTDADLQNICKEALKNGANAIVTTDKDAVKLSVLLEENKLEIPVFVLKLKLDIDLDSLIGELPTHV